MNTVDVIKIKMEHLYKLNPNIHVNVSMTSPKVKLENEPVVIKGIYRNFFQIEEKSSGLARLRTHPYCDIITKRIEIKELTL